MNVDELKKSFLIGLSPASRIPVANEGLYRDPLKTVHNPDGDL